MVLIHPRLVWALRRRAGDIKPGIRRFERVIKSIGHGLYRSIAPGPQPLLHRRVTRPRNEILNVDPPAFGRRTKFAHDKRSVRLAFMPAASKNPGRVLVRKPASILTALNIRHAQGAFDAAATFIRRRSGFVARWRGGRRNGWSNSFAMGCRRHAAVLSPGGAVSRLVSPAGMILPRRGLRRSRRLLPAGDFGGPPARMVRSARGARPARRQAPPMPSFAPSAPRMSTAPAAASDAHDITRRAPMKIQNPPGTFHSMPGGGAVANVPSRPMPVAAPDDRTSIGRAIETFFANQARLPPAGMTGFDPRLSPAWAGLQIQG